MKKIQKDPVISELLAQMTLEEKISLLSGKDNWATTAIPRLEIPSIYLSDGPHGVRTDGPGQGRKVGSATAFPSGVTLASTWDTDLIEQVGIAMAEETRFYDCQILLAPCVNIIRTPLAGRNFEAYSEDPYLAGQIGLAFVNGLQSQEIGASLKHFACNNQEFERTRGNSVVDERTLREIYLPAFETIVKQAQPWTVMCAYNRLNGTFASENELLLNTILRDEWGFKGLVVSDWNAVHDTTAPIKAGLDLEMPGPAKWFGLLLKEAVETWQIDESDIDQAVSRVLQLLHQSDKLHNQETKSFPAVDEHREVARIAASSSITLLKNDDHLLPLNKNVIKRLGVIGINAIQQVMGGGSSYVTPHRWITPLEGLQQKLGKDIEIFFEPGFDNRGLPECVPSKNLFTMDGTTNGLDVQLFDNPNFEGKPVHERTDLALDAWWGFAGPDKSKVDPKSFSGIWQGKYKPMVSGFTPLILVHNGMVRLFIDGLLVAEHDASGQDVAYGNFTELICQAGIEMDSEKLYSIRIEYTTETRDGFAFLQLRHVPPLVSENAREKAVKVASTCDAVVVFGGFPLHFETEGADRPEMGLSGDQDEVIKAVIEANPNTVVVINAGSPVSLPWADAATTIVMAYYPGQEGGLALADMLFGDVNPSGKLTFSIPQRYEDNPTFINYPGGRDVCYGEGIFVGYRYYDTKGIPPLFCFGHGLSYSTFTYSDLRMPQTRQIGEPMKVSVKITNTSEVQGSEIVQLYVRENNPRVQRPQKELKAFAKVPLDAGQSKTVTFALDDRAFAYWNTETHDWQVDPGSFKIMLGSSSRDIRLEESCRLQS